MRVGEILLIQKVSCQASSRNKSLTYFPCGEVFLFLGSFSIPMTPFWAEEFPRTFSHSWKIVHFRDAVPISINVPTI